ncbi:serine palmitoyltransferase 2-like isoform X2 [Brevipalpus obovatus]
MFGIPITSIPNSHVELMNFENDSFNRCIRFPGTTQKCLNLVSYNYLGFSENQGPRLQKVAETIKKCGSSTGAVRNELGTLDYHIKLEKMVAKYLGVEDSIIFGMGFATNSLNISAIIGQGSLIISDQYNHASLALGCKLSNASIKVFKHNDTIDLEQKIVEALADGQPGTHEKWKKIIIVLEGLYSMEGTLVDLPEVMRLKKKYKTYLYVDEAHSIGAIGKTGRGVCDHFGIDPREVDILMGTFTKSFGSAGGYLAGKKSLINYIRVNSHSFAYASSMAAPIAQQILSVLEVIMTKEGQMRISTLQENSRYFRKRLRQLGFIVYGDNTSPVVPLLIFLPGLLKNFVKEARILGLGCIPVGYPATDFTGLRLRFCISACHTREMLDQAIRIIDHLGDKMSFKFALRNQWFSNSIEKIEKIFIQ